MIIINCSMLSNSEYLLDFIPCVKQKLQWCVVFLIHFMWFCSFVEFFCYLVFLVFLFINFVFVQLQFFYCQLLIV